MPTVKTGLLEEFLLAQLSFDFDADCSNQEPTHPSLPTRYEWTDDDIDKLRYGILQQTISSVADQRTSQQVRDEAYEWVMSDDMHLPFSFRVCCAYENLNYQKLRDGVLEVMRRNSRS